ncbi:MAG: ribonuclease VapC [Myxococcaceae bacterium]
MSDRFLIDTNVLSELARPSPDPRVVDWFRAVTDPATSAVVVYELARGVERLARSKRRSFLEAWLAELLAAVEVLPLGESSALTAARAEAQAHRTGRPVEVRDLLIAATAQTHGRVLATRNLHHLRGLGVVVYDPFSDQRTL